MQCRNNRHQGNSFKKVNYTCSSSWPWLHYWAFALPKKTKSYFSPWRWLETSSLLKVSVHWDLIKNCLVRAFLPLLSGNVCRNVFPSLFWNAARLPCWENKWEREKWLNHFFSWWWWLGGLRTTLVTSSKGDSALELHTASLTSRQLSVERSMWRAAKIWRCWSASYGDWALLPTALGKYE